MKKQPRKRSIFMRVMTYFKPLRWRILSVILCGIVGIALYSITPDFISQSLDAFPQIATAGLGGVLKPIILYLILCVFAEIFTLVCKSLIINYEVKTTVEILNAARRKLDVVPLSFIDKFEIGKTTHQISVGRKMFQQCLAMFYDIARTVFFFILCTIMMVSLNVTLAIVVVLSLPVTLVIARLVIKRTQKYYTRNEAIEGAVYNFAEERSTLHGFFNANGLKGTDEFKAINQTKGAVGVDTVVGLNETYINFITNFMYLAVTVVFGIMAINDPASVNFAILPAFLLYANRFLTNAKIITTATNIIQPTESSAQVFFGILDCPDDVTADEDTNIKRINGSIVFDKVSDDKVKDISFEIPFGSTVAFLEEDNGTGAEIVELMTKLALPQSGQIKVDNIDLARIRSKAFYERVGVCFDRPFLIDGSIAENIMYGIGKTLPENVIEVTSLFGFDNFIRTLPDSYNTRLTENTVFLTNAEQQAVNLSRTILHAPDVLILNNALTNFDSFSEKKYNDIIIKKLTGRTRILVTKQIMTIQNVDKIYVCKGGRIVEAGTHAELMRKKGEYYNRYTN